MNKSSPDRTPLTSAQLRAGRALIRWSAEDLARASAVGLTTIRRAELTNSETSMTAANDLAVRSVGSRWRRIHRRERRRTRGALEKGQARDTEKIDSWRSATSTPPKLRNEPDHC